MIVIIPGLIMGSKSRSFSAPHSILFWGMFPFLLPVILLIVLYPQINSQAPQMVDEMHSLFTENAGRLGLNDSQLELLYSSIKTTVDWTLRLAPGILFTMFLGIVLFAYLGAMEIGPRFGAILPQLKPLQLWKAGELWLIPLAVSLLFVLLGSRGMRIIGENVLVFMVHLYAFFGICLVDFYFRRIKIPAAIRLIIYVLVLAAVVVVIPLLAVAGVIDSRFDFRKVSQFAKNPVNYR